MKMLQIPTMELDQRIKEEMEINPALEEGNDEEERQEDEQAEDQQDETENETKEEDEIDLSDYFDEDDIPDYKLKVNNHSADDDDRETPLGAGRTFQDLLFAQLGMTDLEESQQVLAEYLIGNLDENGYLRRELAAVANDLAFSMNISATVPELEEVLKAIQELDPPGVGARDLRECLLIQIQRSEAHNADTIMAELVISKYFEEFTKKHYEKIAKRMDIEEDELKPAIDYILHLNPKPG
ncbi:MAG: RNA polymerase sigma-54 factor, partial [Flavobacteriales bacterium]